MSDETFLTTSQGYRVQKTLTSTLSFRGIGLHTGLEVGLKLQPAPPNQGIIFVRTDLTPRAHILAHAKSVMGTELATTLGLMERREARVSTVEHVLAALFAMGITNLTIEVTGPEIPILDGSSLPFMEAFLDCGIVLQPFTTATLKVLKPIKVYKNGAVCELLPRERLRLTTSIDFPHPSIGLQTCAVELTPKIFLDEICGARTFGFLKDVERLKAQQLAQGASLENVLAFSETGVANEEGMRFSDECVRHKLLDAIGDLALCGSWIEGELVSYRGGHSIHLELLNALENSPGHWELIQPAALSTPRAPSQAWISV